MERTSLSKGCAYRVENDIQIGSTPLSEVVMNYSRLNDTACELMKLLMYEFGCDINARGKQVRFGNQRGVMSTK